MDGDNKRLALVTGGNRGIGMEICRQFARAGTTVLLGARNEQKGKKAQQELRSEGLDVIFCAVDILSEQSVEKLLKYVGKAYGRLDIIVNNAAILIDNGMQAISVDTDIVRKTLDANLLGPLRICRGFIPMMRRRGYGRIVNVSSGMGAFSEMSGGNPAYRISKTALNALTRILAAELSGTNILVNAMCPGWVRTDMGGANAPRTVAEGADTAIWLAMLPDSGASGKFFRDRKKIDW